METTSVSEDCCVKVAVHIRPLIVDEKLQGGNDCVTVTPGKPQVLSLFRPDTSVHTVKKLLVHIEIWIFG